MAIPARSVSSDSSALSRRGFLGLSLGAGAMFALSACGASSGSAPGSAGTIKWAWQLPTSWDPVTSSAGSDVQMHALVYDALTALDDTGNPVPYLAESWAYNDSGTRVTFTLRPGLAFSDGTALDADAVAKSLERGRSAKTSLVAPQMENIKRVSAAGKRDVVIELTETDYQYPLLLAGKTGMVVNPAVFEKDPASLATQPEGSGPFKVTSYTENAKAVMVKNDRYFASDEVKVDRFELYPQAEESTVVASLQSGQYNVARMLPSQIEAAQAAGLQVQVLPSMAVSCLDVHIGMEPFTDPAVVEAMKFGIDREEIKQVANFGIGDVNYQPFPKGALGYNPDVHGIYAYDPDKARKILTDAGHTKPVSAKLSTGLEGSVPELIQAQLKKVGIDLTLETIPRSQTTQQIYIERSKALAWDYFAGRESPVQAFQVLFGREGLMNPNRTTSPALEKVIAQVKATPLEDPAYPQVLQEATKVAVATMPNTFLVSQPWIIARPTSVSKLPANRNLQRFEGVTAS
jgi:peptide/nickel transport system substrate-binding protein